MGVWIANPDQRGVVNNLTGRREKSRPVRMFTAARLFIKSHFEVTCRQSIAPIVAAARCFVSVMGRQRLQRIAGLAMIREGTVGSK
ncbi:MAG: hypothetical protein WCL14_04360 [Bacteroidota bacterium]